MSDPILVLDTAIRGAAICVLILLAGMLWRSPIGHEGRISVAAIAVAKSAYLVVFSPLAPHLPPLLVSNLFLLAALTPNAVTWLIVTIFVDPPFRRWPWLVASSICSVALYLHLTIPETAPFCATLGMVLYAALMGLALWSARDDLVECRCRARPGFAIAIAGLAFGLTGVQATGLMDEGSITLALFQSTGTLAVTLAFAIWILRPDTTLWPGLNEEEPAPAPQPQPMDRPLIARIEAVMEAGIWREEGLTIGALASRLSVPEHRLRRAINRGLGHRNFSSFLNAHRIEAAKAHFSDPETCGKTVLEVAYDVGFASLGPFNRAFRAETGQSPTEFRRSVDMTRADSAQSTPIPVNLH